MTHVFISYKHEDDKFVRHLAERLALAGFETWTDHQIRAGDEWRDRIDMAIKRAFAVVLVMTSRSRESEYVTYEWSFAMGQGIPVLPVLLEETPLHPKLAGVHYLDFSRRFEEPWDALVDHLHSLKAAFALRGDYEAASQVTSQAQPADPVQNGRALQEAVYICLQELDGGNTHVAHLIADALLDTLEALLRSLRHEQADVANAAAYIFEKLHVSGTAWLLAALSSERATDRAAAIRGAKIIRIPEAIPEILRLCWSDESREVRREAAGALKDMGGLAVPALLAILSGPDDLARYEAVSTLGDILEAIKHQGGRMPPEAVHQLLALLHDENPDIRIAVADVLGQVGGRDVADRLSGILLNDPDIRVIYASIFALSRIKDSSVVPALMRFLSHPDGEVRRITIAALGNLGAGEAIHALAEFAQNPDEDEIVRIASIQALGNIKDARATPVLLGLLNAARPLPENAAAALGSIADPQAAPALVALLGAADPTLQGAAVKALGSIKYEAAIGEIERMLDNDFKTAGGERLCDLAAEALQAIGTPRAVDSVRRWRQRQKRGRS